jgi:hypothetical protein
MEGEMNSLKEKHFHANEAKLEGNRNKIAEADALFRYF